METYDLLIVGGGASGLAAAVFAHRFCPGWRIGVLEKQARTGRKLIATGNGTCNITNTAASPAHYHGAGAAAFTAPALAAFPPADTVAFFASLGVLCEVRENGRVYPVCGQAAAVLDCLRMQLKADKTAEITDCAVESVSRVAHGFTLKTAQGSFSARRVIVAAGGAASPSLGGTTDGYALLTALGHQKTFLFPSVVQVKTDPTFVRSLKGIRADGVVSFRHDGQTAAREQGEILFTEYGLSGPAVMQIARIAGDFERRPRGVLEAVVDFLPAIPREETVSLLRQRTHLAGRTVENYLTGWLNKRLGQTLCRAAGMSLTAPVNTLTAKNCEALADVLKGWVLPVTGTKGMGGAQVTAGGIRTAEIDPRTMESRLVSGLYITGEVQDVDGDCGGYNLQWAWASAYAAAAGAAGGEQTE